MSVPDHRLSINNWRAIYDDGLLMKDFGFSCYHIQSEMKWWPRFKRIPTIVYLWRRFAAGDWVSCELLYPHFVPFRGGDVGPFLLSVQSTVARRNARAMEKAGVITDPDARKVLDLCP